MNREIKFRAWEPDQKRMLDCAEMPVAAFKDSRWPIMQFTGLHDKNGKEIYEGDIFECMGGDGKNMMQGEIYFDGGGFRMRYGYQKPKDGQREGYFLSGYIGKDRDDMEVIGNIYENPDLLK